jgi:hypothetical protein
LKLKVPVRWLSLVMIVDWFGDIEAGLYLINAAISAAR